MCCSHQLTWSRYEHPVLQVRKLKYIIIKNLPPKWLFCTQPFRAPSLLWIAWNCMVVWVIDFRNRTHFCSLVLKLGNFSSSEPSFSSAFSAFWSCKPHVSLRDVSLVAKPLKPGSPQLCLPCHQVLLLPSRWQNHFLLWRGGPLNQYISAAILFSKEGKVQWAF